MPWGIPSIGSMLRIPGVSGMGMGASVRMPGASMPRMPSIWSAIRMANRSPGMGMRSMGGVPATQIKELSQQAGVNLAKPPQMALPTEESRLQTALNQTIGRAQFATDAASTELLKQLRSGQGPDMDRITKAAAEGFKLNPAGMKSGINVMEELGFPKDPQSLAGKLTKVFMGTAWDFAVNPLNALHFGTPSKLGKTFETKGTGIIPGKPLYDEAGKPIPAQGLTEGRIPLTDIGAPGGWGDQLVHGLRSAIKIGPIESPDFLNRMVGHTINYLGSALRATPLIGPTVKAFHEGKLNYLRPHFETLDAMNRDIKKPEHPEMMRMEKVGKTYQEAVSGVHNKSTFLDPIHDQRAQAEGAATPEERVHQAAVRYMDQFKIAGQGPIIEKIHADAARKAWLADSLEKNTPYNLADKAGERYLRILRKQPPEIREQAIRSLRADALTMSQVRDELQFSQDHPEVFDPKVQELGNYLREVNEKDVIPAREKVGAAVMEQGEYGLGRTLTPEARAALEKFGGKPSGTGTGGRIWDQASYNQKRVLNDWTLDQANRLFKNPLVRKKYFPAFGMSDLQREENLADLVGMKSKQPLNLFNTDPVSETWRRLLNAKEAVHSFDLMKDVKNKFGYDTPEAYFASAPPGELEPPSLAKVPTRFQKAFGQKEFYTTPQIAAEFNQHVAPLVEPKAVNTMLRQLDTARFLIQKITLFGIPLYSGATAVRNFFGHGFFSILRGAWHPEAMSAALEIAKARVAHEMGLSGKGVTWDQVKAKLPTSVGSSKLNYRMIADDIDLSGQMKAGQAMMSEPDSPKDGVDWLNRFVDKVPFGPTFGAKLDNFMSHLIRTQHYVSRLLQGWEGGPMGAAMRDVKDSMIDYSPRALSPFENERVKRLFLFYAFMRFNFPLMLQAILQRPGAIAATNMMMRNVTDTFGQPAPGEQEPDERFLDSFINGNLHMRVFKDANGNWNYFVLKNFLPLADMQDLMSGHEVASKALSSLNPLIKVALEQAFNKSAYFSQPGGTEFQPIERFPGEKGELLGFPVSKRVEVAIKEILRPANALDQFNPADIFGVAKKMGKLGAYKGGTPLTGGESIAAMLAFKPRPYDEARAQANASFNFRNMFDQYRNALLRAQRVGDVPNVNAALAGIRALMTQSVPMQRRTR